MKLSVGLSVLFFSTFIFANEVVTINVDVKSKLDMRVVGVYQTQKDSFFCKKTSFADGQIRRLPIITDEVVKETSSTGLFQIDIVEEKNDTCQNQLKGLGISFSSSSPLFKQNLTFASQEKDPKGTQKILIGPSKYGNTVYYVSNTSEIKIGPSGVVTVSVEMVNYDPLPPRK